MAQPCALGTHRLTNEDLTVVPVPHTSISRMELCKSSTNGFGSVFPEVCHPAFSGWQASTAKIQKVDSLRWDLVMATRRIAVVAQNLLVSAKSPTSSLGCRGKQSR